MNRCFLLTRLAVAAALTNLCLMSSSRADSPVPHKEQAVGQVVFQVLPTATTPGRQEFVGGGIATHMGQYSQVGGHDFWPDGTLIGTFESTAADGSTISGIYYGTFQDIGGGQIQFNVTAQWLVGTGRLTGMTGIGDVVAIMDAATGQFHYDTDAAWIKP